MSWGALFSLVNLWAMLGWALLLFLPRRPLVTSAVLYLVVFGLCLTYAALLVALLMGWVDAQGTAGGRQAGFTTIAAVRAIFASDGGVVVGWAHYLALDLFAGLWIARDADAKSIGRLVQTPILLSTFVAGPVGLLLYLVVREPAARRLNRPRAR